MDQLLPLDKTKAQKLAVIRKSLDCISCVLPVLRVIILHAPMWDHRLPRTGEHFYRCPSLWNGPNWISYTIDPGNYRISLLSCLCPSAISQTSIFFHFSPSWGGWHYYFWFFMIVYLSHFLLVSLLCPSPRIFCPLVLFSFSPKLFIYPLILSFSLILFTRCCYFIFCLVWLKQNLEYFCIFH